MAEWIALKEWLAGWIGLERDALHILAGILLLFGGAALLRRPIASLWPWLAVLAVELANEAASGFADGRLEPWEIAVSRHDIFVVMLAPTLLTLLARTAPRLYAAPKIVAVPQPLLLIEQAPYRKEPVDADYVELANEESGQA